MMTTTNAAITTATVKKLRDMAKNLKIKGYSKMNKGDLIAAIESAGTVVPVGDLPMTKDRMVIPDPVVEKKPLIGGSVFVESKAINVLKGRGFTTVKHPDFKKICAAARNYYGTHYPGKVNVYHVRPLEYNGILCVLMILQEYGTSRYCAMGANLKYSNGKYSVTNIKTVKC